MTEIDDTDLKVYAVWVPMLKAEAKHVAAATTLMPDGRTSHYWDGKRALMEGYTNTLDFPEVAWDIYAIYAPGTVWEGNDPPIPDYWSHQLGTASKPRVKGPYFEIDVFTARTQGYLDAATE